MRHPSKRNRRATRRARMVASDRPPLSPLPMLSPTAHLIRISRLVDGQPQRRCSAFLGIGHLHHGQRAAPPQRGTPRWYAWARAMKAAGVSTMGFGVVVARAREQCEAPALFPATSIGRGKTLQAAQSWLLAAESECQSPRSEDESSGVCKQSGRVLIDFPGGSAATATMLHGAGLIQLQQAVGWGVVGQVPVPQFGGSQVETLVGSGAFGVRQPQQQRRGQGETTDASRPREARLGDSLA